MCLREPVDGPLQHQGTQAMQTQGARQVLQLCRPGGRDQGRGCRGVGGGGEGEQVALERANEYRATCHGKEELELSANCVVRLGKRTAAHLRQWYHNAGS